MSWLKRAILVLPLFLAACAIGDTAADATPPPPITLMPPPEMVFQGDCNVTQELELWLQTTNRLAGDFQAVLNETAEKPREQMYEGVLALAALREALHRARTPDCGVDAQIILGDAMNSAIETLQAFANGARGELGDTIALANDRIEEAMGIQGELILRMETQIRQALGTTTP